MGSERPGKIISLTFIPGQKSGSGSEAGEVGKQPQRSSMVDQARGLPEDQARASQSVTAKSLAEWELG